MREGGRATFDGRERGDVEHARSFDRQHPTSKDWYAPSAVISRAQASDRCPLAEEWEQFSTFRNPRTWMLDVECWKLDVEGRVSSSVPPALVSSHPRPALPFPR